ncbi:MAG: hypothetical protein KAR31_07110 [Candidatus Omnitrophica bacterium]|nr:hypothetical protein [Candidatus Omnitrophota bacterium]
MARDHARLQGDDSSTPRLDISYPIVSDWVKSGVSFDRTGEGVRRGRGHDAPAPELGLSEAGFASSGGHIWAGTFLRVPDWRRF